MMAPKSPGELAVMAEGGRKLGTILDALLMEAVPGTALTKIEESAQKMIAATGGTPSFMTVNGYHWATCLCVNDEVVHGIPTGYVLKDGDVLTIDIGLLYKGFHTDTAWTKIVGTPPGTGDRIRKFLETGERTLGAAITAAKAGNRVWNISETIEQGIKNAGYDVVVTLVGHGVGRELHEPPQIPGVRRGAEYQSPILLPGMTIAIEVIYAEGRGDVVYANEDGWTISTKDGSLSAVFEHTVQITESLPLVLTDSRATHIGTPKG